MFKYIAMMIVCCFSNHLIALDVYEWTLDVNTSSKHSNSSYANDKFYNENNDGFGISYGYSDMLDTKFGYFKNSYEKDSFYGGIVVNKDYYFYEDIIFSPGIGLLLVTGYDDTPIGAPAVTPVLHPAISFGHKTIRSTIGYLPYGRHDVITFQTQIQF